MLRSRPRPMLQAVLWWTSLTSSIAWLPLIRSLFDGDSYAWRTVYGSGSGFAGELWLAPILAALVLAMLWAGWRGGGRYWLHALLVLWHAVITAWAVAMVAGPSGNAVWFEDSAVAIPLHWLLPVVLGLFLVLALSWAIVDARTQAPRIFLRWTRGNTRWCVGLVVLLPVQFALLRFGEVDGLTDRIGAIVTVLQWLLVNWALRPREYY